MGGTQGAGVLDVEFGELLAELAEVVIVLDVLAPGFRLAGRHPAGAVGAVAPDLKFVIGAEPRGLAVFTNRSLTIFFGKSSGLHGGDGGNALNDLLAALPVGRVGCGLHGETIMTSAIDIIKLKKQNGCETEKTFLSCTHHQRHSKL